MRAGESRLGRMPRLWGPQPERGPRRVPRGTREGRGRDAAPRTHGGQVQRDRTPLQPVEQPRQLIGAARGDQQPHPRTGQQHGTGAHPAPQHGVTGLGGQLQHIEAHPGEQPQRSAPLGRPAQLPRVPPGESGVGGTRSGIG